jgi:class 3 adenylate cyclase/tetratricopeptide (TPR) repeat protein
VICPNCGTENPPRAKFCTECATRLAAGCPACGFENPPGAKFCAECATPLTGAAATAVAGTPAGTAPPAAASTVPRPTPTPAAERRVVTVLFLDLVGFTTYADGRDAEETRDLLTRYFDVARDVIERYGGVVEKFIGDAVMAVWGAPTAHEDDAERAVRAALELVDSVRSLSVGIEARAGVLTGEAAVTLGATNQGLVAGDLVNTASRLQSAAQPGVVLVGQATLLAASRAIAFEEAGEQALKGKISPVPAWRALRVVAGVRGRNRAETLEAPFVGRDEEMRLLKELYLSTARESRARLVSVIGPAGIGKSRLAWEFLKYVDGLVEDVWWHEGRSPAYGEGITFWALGEMVRSRAGLRETDDETTTRAGISSMLGTQVPSETERSWIEPALLALLGVGATDVPVEELFPAWRTFFERLAATGPVALVFEDLHWADSGLLDFIDHLLEWSRTTRLYVVTLARPELLEKRPNWGAGKRNFTSVYLEPLPDPAMRELLAGLAPGLPPRAVNTIVARADGVPLYAVETVRMLVAQGRLALEGDRYVPSGDLATLAVPETLTALIGARLDALDPAEGALLQDASVLGSSFTLTALAAVTRQDTVELEPRLRNFVRREILQLDADPRSPERGQYRFVQALIREVAYGTLARRDRKERHVAAARYFEGIGSDELAAALAGHYLAAHENAGDGAEADALAGQARVSLRAAADRAASLGAHDQAVSFLTSALAVTTDPGDRAELLERAGEEASLAGRHAEAGELLRGALTGRRELGDRPPIARATAALARVLLNGRETEEALAFLEPASEEFADLAPDRGVIALDGQLARAYMFVGDERRALEMCDRVLELAEQEEVVPLVADTLVTKGSVLATLGRPHEALGLLDVGARLAEANGLHSTRLRALNNRSVHLDYLDPEVAGGANEAGLALARRLGLRFWMFGFTTGLGYSLFRTGDWDRAERELALGLDEDPEPADRFALLSNLLLVRSLRGLEVGDLLDEIDAIAAASNDPSLRTQRDDAHAFAAFAAGRFVEAAESWLASASVDPAYLPTARLLAAHASAAAGNVAAVRDDLVAIDASRLRGPLVHAQRSTILGLIAALEGDPSAAVEQQREALVAWRRIGFPLDEALTSLTLVTVLGPDDPTIRANALEARQILERLRARPLIERLDAALAEPVRPALSSATIEPPGAVATDALAGS